MKVFAFLILIHFYTFSVFAVNVKNMIKFSPNSNLTQGDEVEISMQIWPVENYNVKDFEKLKGEVVLSHFYVLDLKAERSENNYDVILINFKTIAESPAKINSELQFNFGEFESSFNLPFEIQRLENMEGDFVLLPQPSDGTMFNWKMPIAIVLFFIVLYLIIKKIKNRKKINKKEKGKTYFQTLFHSANSREQFEEVYALKDQWIKYFLETNPAVLNFYKVMEEHQYKKIWNKEELFEVKESFDKIRGGIR